MEATNAAVETVESLKRLLAERQEREKDLLNRLAGMRRIADLAAICWIGAEGTDRFDEDETLLLHQFMEVTSYIDQLPDALPIDVVIRPLVANLDAPEFDALRMAADGCELRSRALAEVAALRAVEGKLDDDLADQCRAAQAALIYILAPRSTTAAELNELAPSTHLERTITDERTPAA